MIIKRWLGWALTAFVALLLILLLIVGWLTASQSGFQSIMSRHLLPAIPKLTINHYEGRLLGVITLRDINFKNEEIDVSIKDLYFKWHPSKLFSRTIDIDTFKASAINIIQLTASAPPKEAAQPTPSIEEIFKQLKLPVNININTIEISDGSFSAYQADRAIRIQRLALTANTNKESISIKKLELSSDSIDLKGHLNLSLDKANASKNDINGQLSWAVKSPDIKTVHGKTTVTGNLESIQIDNNIAPPYDSTIALSVNDLFNNINILSDINLKNIRVSDINAQWPNYQIKGAIDIGGNINTANITSKLEIKELDKNMSINTQANGDWKNNQLAIDVLADIPGIVKRLALKGSIQPKLLEDENSKAVSLSLKWEELNIPDTAKETNAIANTTTSITESRIDIDISGSQKTQQSNVKVSSQRGNLLITGNLKNYIFSLDTLLNTNLQDKQGQLTQGALSLKGTGNNKRVTLADISLSGAIGTLNGQGSIILKPELIATLSLSGGNLNPAIVSTNWPGDLGLNLSINTSKASNGAPLIKTTLNSTGSLRNHTFSLDTAGDFIVDENGNHELTIEKLLLNSGDSTISADAVFKVNKTLSAKWLISSNNLEELVPNSKGKINTNGTIDIKFPLSKTPSTQDMLHAIKTELTLSAADIDAFDIKIETLTATADLNWQNIDLQNINLQNNNDKNNITLNAQKISFNAIDIESLSTIFNGNAESHQLRVDLKNREGKIDLKLSGQLNEKPDDFQWKFVVQDASINVLELAPWYLQNTLSGELSKNQQLINNHCWLSDVKDNVKKAKACLNANNNDDLSQINFSLADLSVEYFSAFFPENISWQDSIINGQGNISVAKDKSSISQDIDADITLLTTAGKLNWEIEASASDTETPDENKRQQSIRLEAGSFSITSNKNEIKALVKLPVENQTGFETSLIISNNNASFIEREIEGKLNLALYNLAPFNSFIPDSKDLKGKIDSQWRIGGSIAKPWFDGKLTLSEGQLLLISPGIFLENISLIVTGDKQSGIEYQASVNSGGGILKVDGKMQLPDGKQSPQQNLSLKGEKFKIFDTKEALIFVSPDLKIVTIDALININGSIIIPRANITPNKIPASVVTSSEDQIIVDTENNAPANKTQQSITANIDIILGDAVTIDGFGFKGATTGSLNIIKQEQGPVLGNGKINIVDGEYRAFGQGLVIEKGLILFTGGPVAKPGIDIKALRRPAEGITVGVFARGSLSQPDLTIFSEPSMTQSEQLSWLVLGRPLEQSSDGESNAINQLLLSLSLSKGDSIISNLGETFKLDTLRLKTGSGEAGSASDNGLAELVLGKYLSPELYVSYGIGLFKPVNILSLEYSLSRSWKLISETSAEISGGDVVYTIEK
jgi:translocation and assembly module TamB